VIASTAAIGRQGVPLVAEKKGAVVSVG